MAGWNRGRVGAGWCVAGLLIVLVAGCEESPGLARWKSTRRPVPPRGGDPSARIAALIGELDQIEARGYGVMGGEDPKDDPIVVDLIAEGEPAVEPLLAALATDDRLTKTTLWHHGDAQGVLPVSRLVHHALKRLMKTNRFSEAAQFSERGDEAELKTLDGRKRLAGLAREFWRKNRGVPLGERFYRDLADDDAAPLRWVEAAAGLVAPADDEGVPAVNWVTLDRPNRAAPGRPRHGDEVKDRVPTVSDLLAQRAAELAGNDQARTIPDQGLIRASKLGLLFVSWDERAALPTIKRLREKNVERSKDPKQDSGNMFYSQYIKLFSTVLARSGERFSAEPPARKDVAPQLPKEAPEPPLVGGLDDDARAGADEKPVLSWDQRSNVIGGHNVLSLQAPAGRTLQSVTWEIEGTIASQEIGENGFVNTPFPNPLIDRPGPGTTEAVVSFSWDGRDGERSVTAHAEMPTSQDDPPDGDRAEAPAAGMAVRVEGVVRERGTGEPVAGALVRITKAGGSKGLAVHTDEAGRYAFNSTPGKVGAEVTDLPGAYVLSPALVVRDLAVPGDAERFTLPPIEAERGAGVNGVVVDEAGRPVAGATVGGQWRLDGPGWRLRAVVGATTAADGTFELEGIQPGAKVAALWARHGDHATVESPRARAGRADHLTLRVVESGTLAITGRVVGPDGRPAVGAVVNVFHRTPYAGGNGAYGGRVRFDNSAEVRTGPDGTYRTPRELRPGIAYRVEVAAADGPPASGPFVELTAGAGPTRVFPDVLLGGPTRAR
jgi:protocatechuate 3,4-dioxygenase beta subunit